MRQKMKNDSHIHEYPEARVLLTRSGELMIGLPVYANHAGAILEKEDVNEITGIELSIGMYENIGYIAYHPDVGELVLSRGAIGSIVEDLGDLD
jgi:hypothetical protein